MDVFRHCLYEYVKGVRSLVLHTCKTAEAEKIKKRLENMDVSYALFPLTQEKFNIFFGKKICVEVVKKIGKSSLTEYSPEEDFILGIMLGYNSDKQCERYLKMHDYVTAKNNINLLTA